MRSADVFLLLTCASVFGFLATGPAAATIWTVPGDAATIQGGVDLASYGDTVSVVCNTYQEHGIVLKSGVVLRSETGLPDCVTIDAQQNGRVFFGESLDATTVVEGFTLINGLADGDHPEDHGGGIRLLYADLTIRRCTIMNCTATSSGVTGTGGAIEMEHSSPLLEDLVITGNYAQQHGGGISIYYADSQPEMTGCHIASNSTSNSTQAGGGGAFISDGAMPTLTDCLVEENVAGNGAGIWIHDGAAPIIQGCTVANNQINTSQGHGAGVYFSISSGELRHCVLAHNEGSAGGGIGVYGAGSSPVIGNCTVVYNTVNDVGGGIRVNASATPTIENTIIAFNTEEGIACYGGAVPTLACCDIHGNSGGDELCGIDGGDNCSADPLFCNPDDGDYHLRCSSPCAPGNSPGECGLIGALDVSCAVPRAWFVVGDGTGDATTIQGGIDLACEGDTVVVACGVYHEHDIVMRSGIILTSETGRPDCVIIEGESLSRVFDCDDLSSTTAIVGFTITDGYAHGEDPGTRSNKGGGMRCWDSEMLVSNCDFLSNAALAGGGLCVGGSASDPLIHNCRFLSNTAEHGGGAVSCGNEAQGEFEGCIITGNYASEWGGAFVFGYLKPREIRHCTISGNSAGVYGGGIYVDYAADIEVSTSIVSGNCAGAEGDEVYLWEYSSNPGRIYFTCSNVNALGVEGPGEVTYIADNSFADPLFCDPVECGSAPTLQGDYHLSSNSPGLYAECGPMGALGRGCFDEAPHVISITDVGNDQGGWVRVRWERSQYDAPGEPVIIEYSIYRRQDADRAHPGDGARLVALGGEDPDRLDGWEWVAGPFEARGDSVYQGLAPTLCDSTIAYGMCMSTFFVSARTPDPLVFFDSPPDSGYSMDNLEPAVPEGLYLEGQQLSWNECQDEDFDYFTVYGSYCQWPDSLTRLGYTTEPEFEVPASPYCYYRVTATDFSGLESGPSMIQDPSDGPLPEALPNALALHRIHPNPMRSVASVQYDLPRDQHVILTVFDVTGRQIQTLVNGTCPAGRNVVSWNGNTEAGPPAEPGVYFVRLVAGEFDQSQRVMILR